MRSRLVARARLLCGFFVVVAALLAVRLYFVQIVHGAEYKREATGQYVEPAPDTRDRGSIFFTTKDGELVSAAVMQTGWRIAINPEEIGDAEKTYAELDRITPIDKARFMASADKRDDPYEEVAFRVDDASASKIRALKLSGVLLVADQWRFYPAHELASQALGFVGYQGEATSRVGVYGLEKYYQNTLDEPTSGLYVNPFAEIFTSLESALSSDPASREGSIETSIEPNVEQHLESVLDGVMETYSPEVAGGIIMDPKTGAVYAIAGRPAFDPNSYGSVSDPSVFRNSLIEGRYELGSIMKPLTMAAALDSGAVSPNSTYDDKGCVTRSGAKICNYDLKARGVVPVQEILSQSLNVGATYLADTMGHPTFTRYMRAYGFGQRTGVDLPGEVVGDISILGEGKGPDVNYDTAAFGQGVAVSPIEMIRAVSAVANHGILPDPHVVTAIRYQSGIVRKVPVPEGTRILEAKSADEVTDMLVKVYDDALLGGTLRLPHYSVASKTGTAQIPKTGGGYYPNGTFLHSFFGYFPAHDPRFAIFLFVIKPHGVEYASASLAHPFYDLATYLINYYDLPPDR